MPVPFPFRCQIRDIARWLSVTLEVPGETQARVLYQSLETVAIRIAIDLRIFNILVEHKESPTSLEKLVEITGAERILLARLLRTLAAVGAIKKVGHDLFVPTNVSRTFTNSSLSDGCKFYLDFIGRAWQDLPAFLRDTQYRNPVDPHNCALNQTFNTNKSIFGMLAGQPELLHRFNNYMTGQRQDRANWLDFYPLESQLDASGLKDENAVLIVDVGGAQGHELLAIKDRFPQLRGRMILQDVPETIKQVSPDGKFECTTHDFFAPQAVKGARAYYFRNILHDWSDKDCLTILKNTTSAMTKDYSFVLINEWSLSNDTPSAFAALSDLNMMAICAGMERTETQWRTLLGEAGLRINKVWAHSSGAESLIEASLI